LTDDDYFKNFGITNWAEVHENYGIAWNDHTFKGTVGSRQTYTSEFNVAGAAGKDIYV